MAMKPVTRHWLWQQIASVALVPLALYVFFSFFRSVVFGNGYVDALAWAQYPLNAALIILLLGVGCFHGANGLIGIIEDYVHHPLVHKLMIGAVKVLATLIALIGIAAVIKMVL